MLLKYLRDCFPKLLLLSKKLRKPDKLKRKNAFNKGILVFNIMDIYLICFISHKRIIVVS